MSVIFIMNDSFRRDHLGCYGNNNIKTPSLDEFARRSAVFEQCYIGSYPTVPNRWDLITGRFGFPFRGWQPLGPNDTPWAQLLARKGVHTQMIWDTPMLHGNDYNYTRGFAGLQFVRGQKGDPWITDPSLPVRLPAQAHKIRNIAGLEGYLRNHFDRRLEREYCAGRTYTTAMDWLETNSRHKSFFLWLDMWDPHEPFDCPWYDYSLYADPRYTGERHLYPEYGRPTYMSRAEQHDLRALYSGNVTMVDRWLGHFIRTAEKLGLLRDTLIIWTTDHGHLFGDHDLQGKPGAELGNLYETTTRIPLIVYHPGGIGAGRRIKGIVQLQDILPSVLEFLELPLPPHLEGRSFWQLVTGSGNQIHEFAFSSRFPPNAGDETYTPTQGEVFDGWVGSDRIVEAGTITGDKWAFVCAPKGRPSELYDLQNDPNQSQNVIEDHPQVAQSMFKQWIAFLENHDAPQSRIRPFLEAAAPGSLPLDGRLFAFRDDNHTWIVCATEHEAGARANNAGTRGPSRHVEEVTFGEIFQDDLKSLIHLFGQYYWAEDLA